VLIGANAVRTAGPYPAVGGDQELLDGAFDPEMAERPVTGAELAVFGNALPLDALLATPGVLYVQMFFHADEAIDVTLGVDCSHPVKAWLRGEQLFAECRRRPIRPTIPAARTGYQVVGLRPGWNELLVKIVRAHDASTPECHVVLSSGDR